MYPPIGRSLLNLPIKPKTSRYDELKQDMPALWEPPQLEMGPLPEFEQIVEPAGRVWSGEGSIQTPQDVRSAIKGWRLTNIPKQTIRSRVNAGLRTRTSTPPEATTGQESASVFTESPFDAAQRAIRNQGGLSRKLSGAEAIANQLQTEKAIAQGGNVIQERNLETQKVPVNFSVDIPSGTIGTVGQVKRAILAGAGIRPDIVDEIERAIGAPLLRWTPDEERNIEATVNFYRKPVAKTMAEAQQYGRKHLYRYSSSANVPRSVFAIYEAYLRGGPYAAAEAYRQIGSDVEFAPKPQAVTEETRAAAEETYRPSKYGDVEALSQFGQTALKQGLGIPEGLAGMVDTITGGNELTRAVRPFTEATHGVVEQMMPVDPKNESWLTAKIPQGGGSAAGFMLGSGLFRAPKLGAALLGAATNVQQVGKEFDIAQASQPYPAQFQGNRRLTKTLAALIGAGEALGVEGKLGRFGRSNRIVEGVETGVQEFGQEYGASIANDLNAKYGGKYDPHREIGKNALEEGFLGGLVGWGFGGTSFLVNRMANRRVRASYAAGMAQAQPDSSLGQVVQQAGITPETIEKADDKTIDELTKRLEVWARADAQMQRLQAQRQQLAEQAVGAEAKLQTGRVPTGPELQIADQVAQIDELIGQTQIVQDDAVAEIEEKVSPLFRRLRDAAQQEQQAPSTGAQAPSTDPNAVTPPPEGGTTSPLIRRIAEAVAASQPQVETLTDVREERPDLLKEIRREGGMTGDVEAGELRRIGQKEGGTTGLVQRTGLSPDEMRQRMVSEGLSQAETPTDFIEEVEEELRRRQGDRETGRRGEVTYEDYARSQMSESEREQSDRFDQLLDQPENPFTQSFRRLDNPKIPLTEKLIEDFTREAEREGFDDDFINGWISTARASRGMAMPAPERATPAPAQEQSLSELDDRLEEIDRRIDDKRRQGEETADDWAERRNVERQIEQITGQKFREYPKQPVPKEPAPPVRANVIPEWMRNRNVYRMGGQEITDFVGKLREEKARQDAAGRENVDRGLWTTTRIIIKAAEEQRNQLKKNKGETVPPINEPRKAPTRAEREASQKRATAAREEVEATVPGAGGQYLSSEQAAAEIEAERELLKKPPEAVKESETASPLASAVGASPDDETKVKVADLGLESKMVPARPANAVATQRMIPIEDITLGRDDLSRGRMRQVQEALAGGVKPERRGVPRKEQIDPIEVVPDPSRPGKWIVDNDGNHRIALLKLQGFKGDVPVMAWEAPEFEQRSPLENARARMNEIGEEIRRLNVERERASSDRMSQIDEQIARLREEELSLHVQLPSLIKSRRERSAKETKAQGEPRTVTHPDPAIDGKQIVAETQDGRVVVPNSENKGGVSVVKDRAETPAPEPQATTDLESDFAEAFGEVFEEKTQARERKQSERKPGAVTTPAKRAVAETAKGLDDAFKGLSKLFGGPKLSTGFTFDEQTYAQAKPYFESALAHFEAAGRSAKEAMVELLQALKGWGFGADAIQEMKPYILRYMGERQGLTPGIELTSERKPEDVLGEPDQGADEGVGEPAERVAGPEGGERKGELRPPGRARSRPARSAGDRAERGAAEGGPADARTETAEEPTDRGSHEEFTQDETRAEDQPPSATKRAPDYVITDDEAHSPAGTETKLKANFAALRLLRTLEAEGRTPTVEEQRQLAQFTGWGQFPDVFDRYSLNYAKRAPEREELLALVGQAEYDEAAASTLNAHYTHPAIARAMWRAVEKMGFKGGRVIEPGVGIGNFIGVTPDGLRTKVKWTGVDKNPTSSAIAKLLYPSANIQARPYESLKTPDGFFDLAIGNVPFGDYKPYDPRYKNFRANIHDYFFLKTLDQVRPGGVMALITSTGTMDKLDPKIRQAMAEKVDLVAAIRLPGKTFSKNAGTDVVTDIVFLRRRAEGEKPSGVKWMEAAEVPDPDGGAPIPVNEYFRDNPDQIIGRLDRKGKMYRRETTNVTRLDDFEAKFAAAIERLPENVFAERGKPSIEAWAEPQYAEAGQREGSTVVKDGKIFTVEKLQLRPRELRAKDRERVIGMMKLRDIGQAVLDAQRERQDEAAVGIKRGALKREYERFTKAHGFLHQRTNAALLADDIDGPIILALENWDQKTKKGTVADLAITPPPRNVKPENAGDAVAQSLRDQGKLDLDFMAEQLGTTPEELGRRLVSEGLSFNDPSSGWVDRAEYLSGNVRRKLLEAKEAAAADPSFELNVKVLEDVQPDDIPTDEIHVKLGAPWVPPSDVATFVKELLGLNSTDGFDLAYLPQDGSWGFGFRKTNAGYAAASSEAARKLFATDRSSFADILNAALNDVPIRVFDIQLGPRGEKTSVFNAEASSEANGRVHELKERFKEWIWEEEARSKRLHRFYNDNFNNLRARNFDALHYRGADGKYRLPGMSPNYDLRPQQANAVYRAVQDGVALFGHEVGVGKSATMIASAMEHRRLGLARKPLIATTKSVLPGLAMEARRFYPGAKVLVVEGGLDAAKRKRLMAQIATGDWDIVLTTHDNLEALPVRPEWSAGFIKQQLDEVTAAYLEAKEADAGSRVVKELEKLKQKLEGKYAEIINEKKRDDAVYFEDLGVDMLEIDEFHKYKSLPVYTAQRGVKGIPTGQSDRAVDMLMKMRWVYEMNGGRNIYGATGTPVTNTIAEVYNLQRFFQPQELEARGIQAFDAWAKTFGDFSHKMEQTATGEYQAVTRFNRFANLQELMQMSRQIADVVFAADVGAIKRPMRKEDVFAAEASPEQLAFLGGLQDRMRAIRTGKVKPWEDNALKVASDARKMSLDFRLVDPGYISPVETKVDKLVKNVLQIHKDHRGKTQMIFSDLGINVTDKTPFSVYQDIIRRLVAGGIPRDRIIDFSTITDAQRKTAAERLFDADALIGIGGSEKMGTGVNAQQHLIALHHLDVPWLPAHLEQRDGRGWRQGNVNPEIMINRYVTENSFDTFMWQLIDSKSRFIRAFMRGDENARAVTEEEGESFTEAQIMAIASGDPDLLARVQLEDDIVNLERSERQHARQQSRLRDTQERLKADIPRLERRAARMEEDAKYLEELPDDVPKYVVGGKTFEKRDLTAIALRDAALAASWTQPTVIGTYKDFDIVMNRAARSAYISRDSAEPASPRYEFSPNLDEPLTMMASIEGQARNIDNKAKRARSEYETAKTDLEKIGKEVGKPFTKADQLQAKKAELAELNAKMKAKSKPEEETAEEEKAEEGGVLASLPDRGSVSARDVASPAEHFYHAQTIVKERGKRGAILYMNDHAKLILASALEEATGSKYYHANAIEVTRENLQKAVNILEAEGLASKTHEAEILRVADEWAEVLAEHPRQRSFTFHDVTEFARRRETEIPSDREAVVRKFKRTARHERFHWSQRQVVDGSGFAQVGPAWAQATKGWGKYRRALLKLGHPDNPEILAAETAAHIAAEDYESLGVKTEAEIEAAENWLAGYFERIADRYGIAALDKFGSLLRSASRARERAVTNVYTRQTTQSVGRAEAGATAGAAGDRPSAARGSRAGVQGGAPGGQRRSGEGAQRLREEAALPALPSETGETIEYARKGPGFFPGSPPPDVPAGAMPEQQPGLGRIKSPAHFPDEPISAGAMPERQPGLGGIKSPQFSPNDPTGAGEMPEEQRALIETKRKRNAEDFARAVGDLWHLPKALMASFDISAPGRQGLYLGLPPTQWHRAMRAFGRQIMSWWKEAHFDRFIKEMRKDKDYRDAKAAGLDFDLSESGPISEREEQFASEMASILPWVRWSERAYKTYLWSLRFDTFKKYKRVIDKQFRDPGERFEAYQAAAEWINTSSGRGKFHGRFGQFFDKSTPFLNVFLFAPRYVASRIQMLNPLTYARNLKNPQSRVVFRQQMSELFQSAAMLSSIGALAHAAGASISFDDDDPDFLKLRFGSTRIDVLGGLQQVLRLAFKISRWAAAEMTEDDEKVLRVKRADTRDYAMRYLRGKLSPAMSFITDWLNDWVEVTGERHAPGDFVTSFGEGDYAKMADDIANDPVISRALPLFATDLVAAWYNGYRNTGDVGEGFEKMIRSLPSGVGFGVQDYDRPEYTAPIRKYLNDMGIEPRYPKKDKYETEKEYEARIPRVIEEQAVVVQEFQSDEALKDFPREIQREVLNDAISENGRERMKKLKPEWLHKDWQTQATIEEWKRDMEQNPIFQQMSGAAKKAAMESFMDRMSRFRAQGGKKPKPPRPFNSETVRKIIANSLNQ